MTNFGDGIKIVSVGTSGTDISGNRFYEEYLDRLSQTEAADTWDEMRRSDDQVKMLLRVVKNPIMSARWFIAPSDESDEAQRQADLVTHILFHDMGTESHPKTFEKFKREALTSVEFAYSLFEITQKIVLGHSEFGNYIGLKGLDWRSPKTIEEWYITRGGELEKVRQIDSSQRSSNVFMDGEWLLHIAPEMEGDNYEGISMLRPIYGNWLRKDILRKLQMIGIERGATGVPIGMVPRGQENTTSQTVLEDSLSRFVGHERQYMIVPEGYKVDSLKIEHDAEKVQKAVEAENIGMSKSFLANFMELGLNGTGSFALGTDLSDIFLSGIDVYAEAVRSPVNTKLIPKIVRANFGPQARYPELRIEGINDKAGKEFAEVLGLLTDKGLIQITDRLKEVIHKKFKLPDYDKDAEVDEGSEGYRKGALLEALLEEKASGRYSLAESNVSTSIKITGEDLAEAMRDALRRRGRDLVAQMLSIWKNVASAQRMKRVNALTVPGRNAYKKLISGRLAEIYVQATDGVKKELSSDGLKLAEPTKAELQSLPADSKAAAASQAELLVTTQDADLRKNLFFSFTSNVDVLPTEAQMGANLLDVVERYVEGASVRTAGPNAVASAVNLARNAIFQKKEVLDRIESFVFTNPSPEAPICVQLTNRVFSKVEYLVSGLLPPLHHHCNSWIRAQLIGKPGNLPLSPAGLTIQGTDAQIETIKKSITL